MLNGIKLEKSYNTDSLYKLINGAVDVIWHQGFYAREECSAVLPRIVDACEKAKYTLTKDLQSLGTSIGEATESRENAEKYLRTAAETTVLIRDTIFRERKSPADVVRLLADEYWRHGAMVGRYMGKQMLPNIIRRWPAGGHANPHIDQKNIPLLSQHGLTKRIGVNVYIETPDRLSGGEIEFWHRFASEEEYLAQKRADYGLDRERLGEPNAAIHPEQGDLIMFDAARIHGVRKVSSGSRVTAACFLGVKNEHEPLVIFA